VSGRRTKRRAKGPGSALRKGVALSLAATEIACASSSGSPSDGPTATVVVVAQTPPPTSAEAAPPETPAATEKLRPYAVVHPRAARAILYTWTTREQIEELRRDRVLLTRTESAERGASFFDRVVAGRAASGEPVAKLLRTSAFARARYAWPAPWATVLGWPGETYGEELVRITLKPDAWIAKLTASRPGWEIVDLEDRPVPEAEALKNPARIAAVYFVNDVYAPRRRGSFADTGGGSAFREFVICNESMVDSWSAGTDEIAHEIEAGAGALEALARHRDRHPPAPIDVDEWNRRVAGSVWTGGDPLASPERLYEAALAFPNDNYVPTAAVARTLAKKLRALPRAGALTHRPKVAFPAASSIAPVHDGGSPGKPGSAPIPPAPPPAPRPPRKRPRGTH
jgi:hypothetical protein